MFLDLLYVLHVEDNVVFGSEIMLVLFVTRLMKLLEEIMGEKENKVCWEDSVAEVSVAPPPPRKWTLPGFWCLQVLIRWTKVYTKSTCSVEK